MARGWPSAAVCRQLGWSKSSPKGWGDGRSAGAVAWPALAEELLAFPVGRDLPDRVGGSALKEVRANVLWVFPINLGPMDGVIGGRIWNQHIDRVAHSQRRRDENVINAVFARHVNTIRADLGRVDTGPGISIDTVDQLVGFFIVSQVVIAQRNHIRFVL